MATTSRCATTSHGGSSASIIRMRPSRTWGRLACCRARSTCRSAGTRTALQVRCSSSRFPGTSRTWLNATGCSRPRRRHWTPSSRSTRCPSTASMAGRCSCCTSGCCTGPVARCPGRSGGTCSSCSSFGRRRRRTVPGPPRSAGRTQTRSGTPAPRPSRRQYGMPAGSGCVAAAGPATARRPQPTATARAGPRR